MWVKRGRGAEGNPSRFVPDAACRRWEQAPPRIKINQSEMILTFWDNGAEKRTANMGIVKVRSEFGPLNSVRSQPRWQMRVNAAQGRTLQTSYSPIATTLRCGTVSEGTDG